MTDPTKIDRTPNGLIIDDGRGNVRVHEFSKTQEPPKVETPLEAAQRRSLEIGNMKAEKELAVEGSRLGRFIKSGPVKVVGVAAIALLATKMSSVWEAGSSFIDQIANKRVSANAAAEGVREAISSPGVPTKDMTVNSDGSLGAAPQSSSVDGLGRYGTAFGQARQLVADTADTKKLPAAQKICLLNAFDTALAQTAAEISLDAGRKNIGAFATKFERVGDNAMQACKKGGVDGDLVGAIQSKVFKQDGPIMSQIKGLGV